LKSSGEECLALRIAAMVGSCMKHYISCQIIRRLDKNRWALQVSESGQTYKLVPSFITFRSLEEADLAADELNAIESETLQP
jgi:hypothetical protein